MLVECESYNGEVSHRALCITVYGSGAKPSDWGFDGATWAQCEGEFSSELDETTLFTGEEPTVRHMIASGWPISEALGERY